ncbi:hypothetical protein J3F83DRAFT_688735 [Trichoderma novae-zelandiae]
MPAPRKEGTRASYRQGTWPAWTPLTRTAKLTRVSIRSVATAHWVLPIPCLAVGVCRGVAGLVRCGQGTDYRRAAIGRPRMVAMRVAGCWEGRTGRCYGVVEERGVALEGGGMDGMGDGRGRGQG